ncbi:hypothetical protein M3223_02220 [Paenibacillus pasadenensis]|uniref:hypothetical protein n=1 Tax=Paenibacillus pasadenensis TaxID=217090 RepID=UPI00203AE677|nr:hypothetical protein [Paenibacillus pasadenensis]MCM3746165.1 hypothetical protein [Paenibacillus pasadenensis]
MSGGRPWDRSRPAQPAASSAITASAKGSSSSITCLSNSSHNASNEELPGLLDSDYGRQKEAEFVRINRQNLKSEKVKAGLSPQSLHVLQTLLRDFGLCGAEEGRLLEQAADTGSWSRLETALALPELAEVGAVELRQRFWGERIVRVEPRLFESWTNAVFSVSLHGLTPETNDIRPIPGGSSTRLLSRVLLGALALLSRSGLQLTVKGQLRRKTVQELAEAIGLSVEGMQLLRLTPAWTIDYTLQAAFGLDWMTSEGLLSESLGGWRLDFDTLKSWLELPLLKREGQLLRWVCDRALGKGTAEAAAASVTALLEPDYWYSLDDLQAAADKRSGADSKLRPWLELMVSCGWGELGEDRSGKDYFRMLLKPQELQTIYGADENDAQQVNEEAAEPLLIQQDGELWAGPWTAYRSLWLLELIADRGELRELTSYKLTPKSLGKLQLGGDGGKLISELLEHGCECALPPSVRAALEEWLPAAASSNDSNPAVPAPQPADGSIDFWDGCMKLLPLAVENAGAPAGRGTLRLAVSQAADPFGLESLAAANPISPLEEYAPELGRIPAAWTVAARSYHASTSRQLIESAIELGLAVELGTGASRRKFVPSELRREQGADWSATGFYRCEETKNRISGQLNSTSDEPIRLLLPH